MKIRDVDAAFLLCKTALLVFYVSDACTKLLYYLKYDFSRVSLVFRFAYEVLFFVLILVFLNQIRQTFLKVFFALLALFFVGQILYSLQIDYSYNYIENVLIFNKYFFVFIIYFALYPLQNHAEKLGGLIKVFENILFFNASAAILGFIFQIDLFRTYIDQPYRYGYSGFIFAQNEATLFFYIGISYFYYQHFIVGSKTYKFWFFLLAAILLGTKGIYLCLGLFLVFHFLSYSSLKSKIIVIIGVIFLFYVSSWYLQTDSSQKILNYFILQTQESGLLNMLLSGRNLLFETRIPDILSKWSAINYFIGGQDVSFDTIEMDFFDLFLFFGLVGGITILLLYFFTLFKLNLRKPFNLFFVFSYFLLAFFAGHFFYSAVNALYLCLICLYFYTSQERIKSESE
ncbi:MAG: hypothetical protein ACKVOQ_12790 [Cyclobacteriaceae bacterium]